MRKTPVIQLTAFLLMSSAIVNANPPRFIEPDSATGSSQAVVVDDVPLLHTSQVLPDQSSLASSTDVQVKSVMAKLRTVITDAGDRFEDTVKLNVYVTEPETVRLVQQNLAEQFPGNAKPAVSFVTTRLPVPEAAVALDAVVLSTGASSRRTQQAARLPTGARIYVAGQAEKGATLAEATRKTMQSLSSTLKFLGREDSDIVQVKSFLSPMSNVAEARNEIEAFFDQLPKPPMVWVEWQAPLIEIEVIAAGGKPTGGVAVEYLTPPGMTASPIYSRVARTNSPELIYFSGLYGRKGEDAKAEVADIFEQLTELSRSTHSDLKHLVKATYYCSNNDTSTKLNELRPGYYDPKRPPAASKALVSGVGRLDRGITIDMIAVPISKK